MKAIGCAAIAFCLCATAQMQALEFPWVCFKLKDASELTVAADNLVMNYAEGNLVLTSGSVNESLSVAELASMCLTDQAPAAVDEISANLAQPAAYYTTEGIFAGEFDSVDDAKRALPGGVFIAKSASKSFKVIF